AVPRLPRDIADATAILERDMPRVGPLGAIGAVVLFIGLGFAAEWLLAHALAAMRKRIETVALDSVAGRLRAALLRLALPGCALLAFSLGSVGISLPFPWPPTFRQFVLGYLAAAVLVRAATLVLDFALSPRAMAFRLVPASDAAAGFWQRWLGLWIA